MVRAMLNTSVQDDGDSDASAFQQATRPSIEGSAANTKKAGAATGSASGQGAEGTVLKKKGRHAGSGSRQVVDPSDPRPRTAYHRFLEERKHDLQQQRERAGQPQMSKKELQAAAASAWSAQDHAPRKRVLESQREATVVEWGKRQKLRQVIQIGPEGYATPVQDTTEAASSSTGSPATAARAIPPVGISQLVDDLD